MAEKDKKYYWLKLKRDFFKRHDIQIIESMPNGKDYILFYLKLLCESVDHDGNLRFSEEIPYNEEMLATITRTNIDIVRSAIKIFIQLHMMDVMDDGTYFMKEVNKMLGSETYWAQKKREQREKELEAPKVGQFPTLSNGSPMCPSKSIDKEIDLDLDSEKEKTQREKIDYQLIADMYNSICKSLPSVKSLSEARKRAIKARLNTYTVEDFRQCFENAEASSFLKGGNDRNWTATFDWLIKDSNMAKVLDGNYTDKEKQMSKKGSFDTDDFFEAAVMRSWEEKDPPKTAAEDSALRDRMEALKGRLGQG